ncbi:hypothetical protein D1P53_005693 [Cryptococcus gattii VGV]|nr:hypothetical protein D1P53_005693 [Cryptococcus gattii VGV]
MTTLTPGVSPTSGPAISSPQPLPSPVSPDPSTTISPDKHAAKNGISMCAVQSNYWRVDGHDHHYQHDQDHQMADEDYDADDVAAKEDGQPRICPSSPSRAPLPSQVQPPLILHCPSDPTVHALGVTASGNATDPYPLDFQFTYSDLFRSRNSTRGRCALHDVDVDANYEDEEENGKQMTMSEAVWRKWEQMDGFAKCAGGLFRYAYDRDGNDYRPDMTHVQAIRLVIAASPRKMMTLAQQPTGKTARKLKRSLSTELENEMENDGTEADGGDGGNGLPHSHPYPQIEPNSHTNANPSPHTQTHMQRHPSRHSTSELYTTEMLWDSPAQSVRSVKRYRLSLPPPFTASGSGSGVVSAPYQPSPQLYPYEHVLLHEHVHEHSHERAGAILTNEFTRSPYPSPSTHLPVYDHAELLHSDIPLSVHISAQAQAQSRGVLSHEPKLLNRESYEGAQRDRERRNKNENEGRREEQHSIPFVHPSWVDSPSSCSASAPTSVSTPFLESVTTSTSMASKNRFPSEWVSHHTRAAKIGTKGFWKWDLFGTGRGSACGEGERERKREREREREREKEQDREHGGYYNPYPTPQTSHEIEHEADHNHHGQNQKAEHGAKDISRSLSPPPQQGRRKMRGRKDAEDSNELQRAADGVGLLALAAAKIQR